uniref:CSON015617 protein n=1 Tax=Culicoides sonorensis TaxID=179676 RepID=A0A336LTC5_CULSO
MQYKQLFYILISCALLTVCSADGICNGMPDGTLMPNPYNCSDFYICNGGVGTILNCPEGLHFNPQTLTCEYPEDVQCEPQEENEVNELQCPPEDDPSNLIFYPSQIRCDWYYLCSGGKPHRLSCAPGYHWNQAKFQCDFPQNANCQIVFTTTPSITTTTPTSSSTEESTITSSTEPTTQSSIVTTPTTEETTIISTEPSTISSTEPSTVTSTAESTITTTEESTIPTTTTSSPEVTTDHNGVSCPQIGTYTLPHPVRCEFFVFCQDGISTLQKCPVAFKFDMYDHTCVWYQQAHCL